MDIITLVDSVLENSIPTDLEISLSDIDYSGELDVLDIISLVNLILDS